FDGPLDMRMDRRGKVTAATLVASLSEEELSELLRRHGDEPEHVRIARKIVERRAIEPITRTRQLAYLVLRTLKMTPDEWKEHADRNPGARHPAARTFQALRMAVNDEIGQLEHLLRTVPWCLKPGGRVVILSFHSGEDGRVAEAFEKGLADGTWSEITTEAIRPLVAERRDNPRAASARLRRAVRAPSSE
ncbi:MAG TPA: 16S rRNA (cytosine(1402)-N(4))-methyltransferase, partial [Candidatus Eisenbacteria bacterium]